jgi:putative cell wall-binding protein
VTTSAIGSHELVYAAEDNAGNVSAPIVRTFEIIAEPPPVPPTSERLDGPDRFASSVEIARASFDPHSEGDWPGVTDAVIASGEDRSATDALAAAGLCWTYDAPLLLVGSTSAPTAVKDALAEMRSANGPVRLWIVGGEQAIRSVPVVEELESVAGTASARAAGPDRFSTARACERRMLSDGYGSVDATLPAILLANGADPPSFADALALSPISANQGAPVLLVKRDSVPAQTASELENRSFERVVIAGGPVAVSQDNAEGVAEHAGQTPERWFGADRYETATVVAAKAEETGWLGASTIGIAARLPDALSGGAAVGRSGGVLLFTETDSLPGVTRDWIAARKDRVEHCWVLGGPKSVAPSVFDALDDALR